MGVNVPVATAPPGYLTINQAATELGVSAWRVLELIGERELESVTLVDAKSLRNWQAAS